MRLTDQQLANIRDVLDNMLPSIPDKNIAPGLRFWSSQEHLGRPPSCGTIACFGGWCAWWPAFRAQGVLTAGEADSLGPLGRYTEPSYRSYAHAPAHRDAPRITSNVTQAPAAYVADLLFGDWTLFAPRGGHWADGRPGSSGRSDRWVIENRLRALLERAEESA